MAGTLVISDVHSNSWALEAVIRHAREHFDPDEVWFLGDLLGYGPEPYKVFNRLTKLSLPLTCLAGNHDWGILGEIGSSNFRKEAWQVILFQREHLANQQSVLDFLKASPVMASPRPGIYLSHGSFENNPQDSLVKRTVYLSSQTPQDFANRFWAAAENFPGKIQVKEGDNGMPRLFFIGHTHFKKLWQWQASSATWKEENVVPGRKYSLAGAPLFINPGSVGFPRDPSGCPSYVLLDWEDQSLTFQHVPYGTDALKNAMAAEPYDTLINDKQFFVEPCAQETQI